MGKVKNMKEETEPPCQLKFCIYANTLSCTVFGFGVTGITGCIKYKTKEDGEIYKEALQKICSMMYDHDPPCHPDKYMSTMHQLEECCYIAGSALDRVRGV